ncbi:S8 family peptidase [Longispora albida]|uniref:S8 family peptidase n=1 Tax=Longispora albida TaxID=203523 RepID=UPI000380E70F|nr:S8 family peptidase [Longispora albida]
MRKLNAPRYLGAGVAAGALVLGLAAPVSAEPTGDILGATSAGAVPGSYIVVLKNDGTSAAEQAKGLSARHGGKVAQVYSTAIKGYAAQMSERDAKRVAGDPSVAYVQQNKVFTSDAITVGEPQLMPGNPAVTPDDVLIGPLPIGDEDGSWPLPWGLDRTDQRHLPLDNRQHFTNSGFGSPREVYVLDSGMWRHQEFPGRIRAGADFVNDGRFQMDCTGHGTHVAGTIAGKYTGVTKNASIVTVRVLDCFGKTDTAKLIAGIDWITANAPRDYAVVNASLGGEADQAIDDAVNRSIDAGIVWVVSAGNGGGDACTRSPARVPRAITVGATNPADYRATFTDRSGKIIGASGYGSCVDIFAPGVNVLSSTIPPAGAPYPTEERWYVTMSGTSMAVPHVAAAAAYLRGRYQLTPEQTRQVLVSEAAAGKVVAAGTGSPNLLLQAYFECPSCEFAGAADWELDGMRDLVARDNATGDLWLYPGTGAEGMRTAPRKRIGSGFGGVTLAGIGDWDRDGSWDVMYRADSGPQAGNLYYYGKNGVRHAASGLGGATFAGVTTVPGAPGDAGTRQTAVYYRIDAGPLSGVVYKLSQDGTAQVGSGFNGATFAGISDWDSDGTADLVYRIDGGPEFGNLYAYGTSRKLVGSGFGGANLADVAKWDGDEISDVIYTVGASLWVYGAKKYLADYGI